MAIETVEQQQVQVLGYEKPRLRGRISSLFDALADAYYLCFRSPKRLDYLDREYWDKLSVREKVIVDASLMGTLP